MFPLNFLIQLKLNLAWDKMAACVSFSITSSSFLVCRPALGNISAQPDDVSAEIYSCLSFFFIHWKGNVSLFVCIPCEASRRVLMCFSVTSGQVGRSRVNNAHVMWPRHACRARTRSPEGLNDNFILFESQFRKCVRRMTKFFGYYLPDGIGFFFSPLSLCWNRKDATSAEFCSVITLPSSIKSANTPCVGSWWNSVIMGLPFRLYQRCLWMGTVVGRGQTTVATAMAPFQRCTGKTERWRRQQRHEELGKLFYIIPRHNRTDLSVHTRTQRGEAASATPSCMFFQSSHSEHFSGFHWI